MKRARINLPTSAAIDREVSARAASWGGWAEDFIPRGVIEGPGVAGGVSPSSGELVFISVWKEFRAGLGRHCQSCDENDFLHSQKGFPAHLSLTWFLQSCSCSICIQTVPAALGQHIWEELSSHQILDFRFSAHFSQLLPLLEFFSWLKHHSSRAEFFPPATCRGGGFVPMVFRHLQGVCVACTESALKRRTGYFK